MTDIRNGVENHVSAAFSRENVAFHGNEDEVLAIAANGPRGARFGCRHCRWQRSSLSGLLSISSFLCREATLDEPSRRVVEESERRWAYVVAGVIGLVFAVIIFSSVHWAAQPPSNVETIDASRLHLAGEFVEDNLGTEVQPDGSVIVRVIAQQYSFVPSCIVVPAEYPGRFPRDQPRRRARISHHGHKCEQHGGARDSSRKCVPDSIGREII